MAIQPGGSARPPDRRRQIGPVERPASRNLGVLAGGGPGGDDGHRVVGLAAGHPREVRAEQRADLFGDGTEELARGHSLRDERRHAPQGRLLLREPRRLGPSFGVRDRGGDELREGGDPRFRVHFVSWPGRPSSSSSRS